MGNSLPSRWIAEFLDPVDVVFAAESHADADLAPLGRKNVLAMTGRRGHPLGHGLLGRELTGRKVLAESKKRVPAADGPLARAFPLGVAMGEEKKDDAKLKEVSFTIDGMT